MIDPCGRKLDYLRVSITDRCNLRCSYCMPAEGVPALQHKDVLALEETTRLCRLFASLGVTKFKVTGGEPLVRKGGAGWIKTLKEIEGAEQVTLTTNGVLLCQYLPLLLAGGLDAVNISLDTLQKETYHRLTGFDTLDACLQGMRAAKKAGLKVKINAVPLRGVNEGEYATLAALARSEVDAVRFIELMPVGFGAKQQGVPLAQVEQEIQHAFGPLAPWPQPVGNGPAVYYSLPGFKGKIGMIAALSHQFCKGCNRLRLTADGYLKLCLAHDVGTDLKGPLRAGATDDTLREIILRAVEDKPVNHSFGKGNGAAKGRGMFAIGG